VNVDQAKAGMGVWVRITELNIRLMLSKEENHLFCLIARPDPFFQSEKDIFSNKLKSTNAIGLVQQTVQIVESRLGANHNLTLFVMRALL